MAIKRYNPCGKIRYTTEREAIRKAIGCSRNGSPALRVYRCPDCKGWHLAKRPTWNAAAGKKAKKALKEATARPEPIKTETNSIGHFVTCACGQCAWLDDQVVSSA